MFMLSRFWLAAVLASGGLLLLLAALVFGCWQQLTTGRQDLLIELITDNSGFALLFAILFGCSWWGALLLIYRFYVKPVYTLADELLLILSVNPSFRIGTSHSRGLTRIAELINEGADRYQSLEKTAEDRLSYHLAIVQQEKNILHAVLGSLAEGIVICTTIATNIWI